MSLLYILAAYRSHDKKPVVVTYHGLVIYPHKTSIQKQNIFKIIISRWKASFGEISSVNIDIWQSYIEDYASLIVEEFMKDVLFKLGRLSFSVVSQISGIVPILEMIRNVLINISSFLHFWSYKVWTFWQNCMLKGWVFCWLLIKSASI